MLIKFFLVLIKVFFGIIISDFVFSMSNILVDWRSGIFFQCLLMKSFLSVI